VTTTHAPLSSGRSFSGLNLSDHGSETLVSDIIPIIAQKGNWHALKEVSEAVLSMQQKQHVGPMDPFMLPNPSPTNSRQQLQLTMPQNPTPRLNVSLNSSFSHDSYTPRRPYSARFPSPRSDYDRRAFRPVQHPSDRIPDHRLEEKFSSRDTSRRDIRRQRRSARQSYPVANMSLKSNFSLDNNQPIVPSKRTAPPTKEPEHKRVRRNQIRPPPDTEEDAMEEEEKRQEMETSQSRKRKFDTSEMETSPIDATPKISAFASNFVPTRKERPKQDQPEPMKTTPTDAPTAGLFAQKVSGDLFKPKPASDKAFSFNMTKEKKPNSGFSFLNKDKNDDATMSSLPKAKKRKIEVEVKPTETLSIDSTKENTKKATQKPAPPRKENYMTRMLRERGEKVNKHYKELIKKLYQEKAPGKVKKVDYYIDNFGPSSRNQHDADHIHNIYLKMCKKYQVTAKPKFDGSDADVMDFGEEDAPAKVSIPSLDTKDSGSSGFKFEGFKMGNGSDKPLGGMNLFNKNSDKKEDKNTLKLDLPSKDENKDGKLKIGSLLSSSSQKPNPFTFKKSSDAKKNNTESKSGDLFGSAKIPTDFSILGGTTVDFTKSTSTTNTPSSSQSFKPQTSSKNPFAQDSGSSNIQINLGGGSFGKDKTQSRMSITSDNGMGGSKPFSFNNNTTKSNNPFSTNSNTSPFANFSSQQSNKGNSFTNFNPQSSQGSFNPRSSQGSFNASAGGFSLGKIGNSKKRRM